MLKIYLILIIISENLLAACIPLDKYVSDFNFTSIINSKPYFDQPTLKFKVQKNNICKTIVSTMSGKIIDSYPKNNDKESICTNLNGYYEISLIKSIVYEKQIKLLAILVVNEYTISFASGGINPYYGYHLYIYKKTRDGLQKLPQFDQIGWGGGVVMGNQKKNNHKLFCENSKAMKYIHKSNIINYLYGISILQDLKQLALKNNLIDGDTYKILSKIIKNNTLITPKTLTQYNNIAYYLQQAGANEEAIYLLEKIIKKFPNRTVAYINLGDAYRALGEKDKARKAYTTYIEQMCAKGLQKKIPKRVLKRVRNKR